MNGRRDGDPYGRAVREGTPACCLTCGYYHLIRILDGVGRKKGGPLRTQDAGKARFSPL